MYNRPLHRFAAMPAYYDPETLEHTMLTDEEGNTTLLPVDQFSGKSFMLNSNGFIMNDIMQFEEAQSDGVARAALARLQVLHPDSLPADMTVDDAMKQIVPANFSSPAEYMRLEKSFAEKFYNEKLSKLDAKESKEKIIEFSPVDTPKTD